MKKILEKIQKKLNRLDALHEKESQIVEDINEMIEEELEPEMDWDEGDEE